MNRLLLFGTLMFVSCALQAAVSDELRFYYYPIDAQTLVPITRATIREAAECRGRLEQPSARALRAFVSQPLTRATSEVHELGIRVLVEGADLEVVMDSARHMSVGAITYAPTDKHVAEFLGILKSSLDGRQCPPEIWP